MDRVVILGIGGSYLGARALFEALRSTYHNELPPNARLGVPRIYFEGNNVDNDALQELFDLLANVTASIRRCARSAGASSSSASRAARWRRPAATASSAARWPSTTAAAADKLPASMSCRSPAANGKLRDLCKADGYREDEILTIPDDVGGRFSVFTAGRPAAGRRHGAGRAGPAARRRRHDPPLPRGAVRAQPGPAIRRRQLPDDAHGSKPIRVLSVWSKKLEALGLWYDQLLAESLGKHGHGPTPLTTVQTRDLHSRGQQHQEGIARQDHQQPRRQDAASTAADHDRHGRTATRTN